MFLYEPFYLRSSGGMITGKNVYGTSITALTVGLCIINHALYKSNFLTTDIDRGDCVYIHVDAVAVVDAVVWRNQSLGRNHRADGRNTVEVDGRARRCTVLKSDQSSGGDLRCLGRPCLCLCKDNTYSMLFIGM